MLTQVLKNLVRGTRPPSINASRVLRQTKLLQYTAQRGYFGKSPPPDFDTKKDYYKELEINEKASQQEVKNAFYRLAQFYHPDRNNGMYLEKFKEITAAY